MNNFIKFYTENNISPVSQNITDLGLHFNRRNGLYRSLGLTPLLFKNRDILEIAPGSGYNSIITASYEPNSYDLVEPNPSGYKKMINLFEEYEVSNENTQFYNVMLENFSKEKQYDVVLCEGLLPGLSTPNIFLQQLADRVRPGGVLVITCADAISVFFESLRRYLARIFVSNYTTTVPSSNNNAVQINKMLSNAFEPHLAQLGGMSRPIEDWIWDNLLNPAAASLAASNEFSIDKCFEFFGNEFYYYGSSPILMQNFTWYKNLFAEPNNYNSIFLESFNSQRHNLLNHNEVVIQNNSDINKELYKACKKFALQLEQKDPINPGKITLNTIKEDLLPVWDVLEIVEKCKPKASAQPISSTLL